MNRSITIANAISKIAIIYHPNHGHTKHQAEAVLRGVLSVPLTNVHFFTANEAALRLDELDDADAIILGCPTYMGNISAGMKDFIEAAAAKWYTHSWNKKIAGAFTNSSAFPGDKLSTLIGIVINAMQHGMIFVGLGVMPSTNKSEDWKLIEEPGSYFENRMGALIGPMASTFQLKSLDAPSKDDLETAELYGRRVAEITLQFVRGRIAQECNACVSDEIQTSFSYQTGRRSS